MPTLTFDPSDTGPSNEQLAQEATALEQGEMLANAAAEDKARLYQQQESENQDLSLIGGKFKSQEELLKAYKELEAKLGKKDSEDTEDASEEPTDASEEAPEQQQEETPVSETVSYMEELGKQYAETGQLPDEAIDRLSQMDQKELIKSYLQYYQKSAANAQQATIEAAQIQQIKQSVGGDDAYNEMTAWAAQNLSPAEINDFNTITNSGNAAAIKFAVEALHNRYRSAEGYEAPMVTGRKPSSGPKAYRSHAELARDIADPRYSSDPAFRADVEERLARSQDLL